MRKIGPFLTDLPGRTRLSRSLLPLLLALGLLWVASPLLSGQGLRSHKKAYQRMEGLRMQMLCRTHLEAVNLALTQYAIDNDGRLPLFNSPAKLHQQLIAYRLSSGNFVCPLSEKEYQVNKSLGGKKRSAIPNASKTLLMWSNKSFPDGSYMILTANGMTLRVSGRELAKYKR